MSAIGTRYQGVQKDSAGYKLLKSMGWKEGEGLGASKQGIKEHIRVKKKFENWGVGAVESHDRTRDWSNGMSEFHRVLSSLSEITSKHAGSSSSDEEKDTDDVMVSDVKKDKKEKKKKTSKKKKSSSSKKKKKGADDDTMVEEKEKSESGEDDKDKKKATHIGRFKRRESAKMVKGYSSSDLAAILGEDPFTKQAEALAVFNKPTGEVTISSSSDDMDDVEEKPVDAGQEAAGPSVPEDMAVPDDAWWSNYFVRGPRAGSRREMLNIKKKVGFSEKDQEDLYTNAHDHATTGRVGLGRSSMPKKVAGVRWQGKKTKLGDSDDDDEVAVEDVEMEEEAEEDVKIQIVMPDSKRRKTGDPMFASVLHGALSQEKKKSMKLKALVKHALKTMEARGNVCEKKQITEFIQTSTHLFSIDGKVVTLLE
jgi:Pin2-interacting protein X1